MLVFTDQPDEAFIVYRIAVLTDLLDLNVYSAFDLNEQEDVIHDVKD